MRVTEQKEQVKRVTCGNVFETADSRVVRLANVWAPEAETEMGVAATRYLKTLIGGKEVDVQTFLHDGDGASLANVWIGAKSINTAMRRRLEKLAAQGLSA